MSTSDISTSGSQLPADTSDDAERQRREIEATRADMGRTLETLEDRVSPSRIKERQTEKIRGRWTQVKDSVMGSSDHGSSSSQGRAGEMADGAKDAVQHAPDRVEEATRGNPLAAGLIALGVGALAGTLFPASGPERRLASELRDEFEEPVRSELQHAGQEMGEELRDHAQRSVEEVKSTAQDATETTKNDAQSSAKGMQDEAKQEAQKAKDDAKSSSGPDDRSGSGTRPGAGGPPPTPGTRPQL